MCVDWDRELCTVNPIQGIRSDPISIPPGNLIRVEKLSDFKSDPQICSRNFEALLANLMRSLTFRYKMLI
jgi:hypothetical protein